MGVAVVLLDLELDVEVAGGDFGYLGGDCAVLPSALSLRKHNWSITITRLKVHLLTTHSSRHRPSFYKPPRGNRLLPYLNRKITRLYPFPIRITIPAEGR